MTIPPCACGQPAFLIAPGTEADSVALLGQTVTLRRPVPDLILCEPCARARGWPALPSEARRLTRGAKRGIGPGGVDG